MNTHVVILAAGRGARLGAMGAEVPKWLMTVGERTIADHQLAAVERARAAAPGALRVRVVTGHADAAIARYLEHRGENDVTLVHNVDFARLNNWYSVLLALRSLPEGDHERVVIVNSDLFVGAPWMADFVADAAATESESLIGIDLQRPLTDESMKVEVGRDDSGPPTLVRRIGKDAVNDPAGEYVGLLMARGSVLRRFRATLESFVDRQESADEWYERAVGATAAEGTPWTVWPTPDSSWVEIDDEGDYNLALEMTGRI